MKRGLLTLCMVMLAHAASAQTSQDKASADTLFDEAKQLLAAGETAKACALFEGSLKLADQLGTRLNLADCYTKLGRTASAWAEFREAAWRAGKAGDRREKFATDRAAELVPRLVKLVIVVPSGHKVPGLTVRRDGVAVSDAIFDNPAPVDPGKHKIEASADGYKTWSQDIDVPTEGTAHIDIPALVKAPHVAGAPIIRDPIEEARHSRNVRHVTGIVIGALGVAALGTSLVLALEAKGKWNDAQTYCANGVCDHMGSQLDTDARSLGNTATIVAGVGAAVLVTGTIVYFTAPKLLRKETPIVDIAPQSHGFAVTLSGHF